MVNRRFLVFFLLLLIFLFSLGFTTPAWAQNTAQETMTVAMELSPNPVGRGDRFTVTILVPTEDTESIEVEEPQLPEVFSLIGGPNIRPVYQIDEEGERLRKSRITYVYTSGESGRYEIGEYNISTGDGSYRTEPSLMEVGLYRNRSLVIPPDVYWNIGSGEVYVGENCVWILEAEGLEDIRIFEQVNVNSPEEGFFEPIDGIGSIVRYSLGGASLYREPVVEYLFTPSAPGTIRVPRGLVEFDGVRIQSDSPTIEVKPLPERVEENGVVGDFEISTELSRENLRLGENVDFTITIRGTGNLNYLRLPPPPLEDWTIVSEDEEESLEAGPDGYEGYRKKVYTLTPDNEGKKSLYYPAFAALNPQSEAIYSLGGDRYSLSVEGTVSENGSEEADKAFPFSPRRIECDLASKPSILYLDPQAYLWLLPGPVVFLIFFFLRRKKAGIVAGSILLLSFSSVPVQVSEYAREGMQAYNAGEWDRAYSAYRSLLEEQSFCPDVSYNLALTSYRMDRVGESVYFARSAINALPSQQEYRDFLSYLEDTHEIPQHSLFLWPIHPDMLLLILALTVNFSAGIGVIYLFTRKNGYFIVATLFLVISIAMGSALIYSAHSRAREVAVAIAGDVHIKNIPRNDASKAFVLKEGETVEIIGRSEPFLFVRTVLGRRGWIRGEQLGPLGIEYSKIFTRIETERRLDGIR